MIKLAGLAKMNEHCRVLFLVVWYHPAANMRRVNLCIYTKWCVACCPHVFISLWKYRWFITAPTMCASAYNKSTHIHTKNCFAIRVSRLDTNGRHLAWGHPRAISRFDCVCTRFVSRPRRFVLPVVAVPVWAFFSCIIVSVLENHSARKSNKCNKSFVWFGYCETKIICTKEDKYMEVYEIMIGTYNCDRPFKELYIPNNENLKNNKLNLKIVQPKSKPLQPKSSHIHPKCKKHIFLKIIFQIIKMITHLKYWLPNIGFHFCIRDLLFYYF